MADPDNALLLELLRQQRVATLAVLVEGAPFASLVPFAMSDGFRAALIHASRLAKHSAGLNAGAPFSLLIHQPDTHPEANPAQLARVTLRGSIQSLERNSEDYREARDQYLAKFPKSEITFQLGDFTLYALNIESCRLVAGFAKTFDLLPADLARIS